MRRRQLIDARPETKRYDAHAVSVPLTKTHPVLAALEAAPKSDPTAEELDALERREPKGPWRSHEEVKAAVSKTGG
jgi:hypothetical protein